MNDQNTPAAAGPSPDVLVKEWVWKTPAMKAMTLEVLRVALAYGHRPFTAMDLEVHGEHEHGGSGIAGSVFRQLVDAGILAPVGAFVGGEFVQLRKRNEHGNPIGVWRMANYGLAAALYARHAPTAPKVQQAELALV